MRFLRWPAARRGGQGRLRQYYRRGACLVVNDAAAIIVVRFHPPHAAMADTGSTLFAPAPHNALSFDPNLLMPTF
jgi:hypothetical protein